ncbi:MAG: hypothetical protein HQK54_14795 [Oligoflexales bacterium]|nr:hypothetical protein [Oligoflexales bacterium]
MKRNRFKTIKYIELLPYHEWGVVKYQYLGMPYPGPKTQKVPDGSVERMGDIFKKYSLDVRH